MAAIYSIEKENLARKASEKMMALKSGVKVENVGLCISSSHPWLAGSPDDVVLDPGEEDAGLLEIKCPFNAIGKSFLKFS